MEWQLQSSLNGCCGDVTALHQTQRSNALIEASRDALRLVEHRRKRDAGTEGTTVMKTHPAEPGRGSSCPGNACPGRGRGCPSSRRTRRCLQGKCGASADERCISQQIWKELMIILSQPVNSLHAPGADRDSAPVQPSSASARVLQIDQNVSRGAASRLAAQVNTVRSVAC